MWYQDLIQTRDIVPLFMRPKLVMATITFLSNPTMDRKLTQFKSSNIQTRPTIFIKLQVSQSFFIFPKFQAKYISLAKAFACIKANRGLPE